MTSSTESTSGGRTRLYQIICYTFLGVHFHTECYWLFDKWGMSTRITDEILYHLHDTRLLESYTAKTIALLFMVLTILDSRFRKQQEISRLNCLLTMLAGILLYFGSLLVFARNGGPATTCLSYILITSVGFVLISVSLAKLRLTLDLPWLTGDPFGRQQAGFPQEQRLLKSDFSLNLPAQFTWKGEKKDSWINLINPRRGILIMGSPGCGKSYFIIEPLLRQWMEKGNVLFLYDFKYPALSRLAYSYFLEYRDLFPPRTAFYTLNFSDLSRSHRCNLLAPSSLSQLSDALGASTTILLSMNKTWVHKKGEFFVESPINFVGALIWYLRKYKGGIFCTLPHVIELSQLPYHELFPILLTNKEIEAIVAPFEEARKNKNFELLDSQVASARIPLGRLASPELYYLLTGNDFELDINNPSSPSIFCLAGNPPRQEAIAPVLSLCIDQVNKLCNRSERLPCAIVCDEFATVRAYSMGTTIATARSNNIVPILAIQDLSQLRTQYSRDEADLFLNISGNLLCGQVGGETARWVSERFPKIQQARQTVSINSNDTSVSVSPQWEPTVTPATISGLSSGEFVGVVADEPGKEMELKGFHSRLVREKKGHRIRNVILPVVGNVSNEVIMQCFSRVKEDISRLAAEEESKL